MFTLNFLIYDFFAAATYVSLWHSQTKRVRQVLPCNHASQASRAFARNRLKLEARSRRLITGNEMNKKKWLANTLFVLGASISHPGWGGWITCRMVMNYVGTHRNAFRCAARRRSSDLVWISEAFDCSFFANLNDYLLFGFLDMVNWHPKAKEFLRVNKIERDFFCGQAKQS